MKTLYRQLDGGRVHHAQIFHGPQGVGKFTCASAFARVLLCHDPQRTQASPDASDSPPPNEAAALPNPVQACGNCPSCRLLPATEKLTDLDLQAARSSEDAALTSPHPDLHILTKELAAFSDDAATRRRKQISIPVELVRQHVLGPAYRSSQLGHGKVFIIDQAELLNAAGQNALLKTLEEPPAGSTLILVTSSEDRLLPTIRSRCQRVAFVPLDTAILSADLDRRDVTLDPTDREWLLRFANGSLGRLDMALTFGLKTWARDIIAGLDRLARSRPAPTLGGRMHELQNEFAESWVKQHPNGSKEAANKLAASLMAALIGEHARHHLAQRAAKSIGEDLAADQALLDPWLAVIDAVQDAQSLQARAVNAALVSDHLAASLEDALATRNT